MSPVPFLEDDILTSLVYQENGNMIEVGSGTNLGGKALEQLVHGKGCVVVSRAIVRCRLQFQCASLSFPQQTLTFDRY